MTHRARGFILIELMIVVAIIAILAAIALTAYHQYQIRAAEGACLAEVKNYVSFAVATLQMGGTPLAPPLVACLAGSAKTEIGTDTTATPHLPGTRISTCDMDTATCTTAP